MAREGPVEIPHTSLSPEVLQALIEEFVTREGTEYGRVDVELETKVAQVLAQLERGEAVITFDDETQTCSIEAVKA